MSDLAIIPRDMPRTMASGWAAHRQSHSTTKSASTPIVFVVDDDASVLAAHERLAASAGWRCATFASAADFLARPRIVAPSCLVLDMGISDLGALDQRLADIGDVPVVLLTGPGEVPMIVQARNAGTVEFVTRPFSDDVLRGAVERALERSKRALNDRAQLHALRERYGALSAREREVMALVAGGLLNKQVGSELGISEITVKAHRGSVMRKMGAASFAALVRMADKLGIAAIERAEGFRRPLAMLVAV